MTTFGVSLVKDEADIIGPVLTHMLGQVDRVIVADNGSTDGTREILEQLDVEIVDDPDRAHYQSRKMTALAARAAAQGATWIVPFDADEWWYSPFGRIADVLADINDEWLIATADLFDHVATGADPDEPDPTVRIGWRRRHPLPLPKVAVRYQPGLVIEEGNHSAHFGFRAAPIPGRLVVHHFPYRSPEHFVAKVRKGSAAIGATDLPVTVGAHWRQYGELLAALGPGVLEDVFRKHFWVDDPAAHDDDLIYDPAS